MNTHTSILDPGLPQLHDILNEAFMREFFQNHCSENEERELSLCQIIEKRYRPGKWCIVTYALAFGSEKDQRQWFLQAYAAQEFECEQERSQPRGVRLIPELKARLWQFPHDPELKHLPQLMDADAVQNLFANNPIYNLNETAGRTLTIQPLKYVPVKSCLLLVQVGQLLNESSKKFLAKLYPDASASSVFDTMQELWIQQSNRQTAFSVVAPIGYDEETRTLWQRWSPGEGFINFVGEKGLTVACSRVAVGLADLHGTRLGRLTGSSAEENLQKLEERASMLMNFQPRLRAPMSRLLNRLKVSEELRKPVARVPIHGDFNYSQILFSDGKPVFIDLESVRLGDPLYDVAHFVAGLHSLDVPWRFNLEKVTQTAIHFWQIYKSHVTWEVSDQALRAQVAVALICRRAYKVLTRLEENAVEKIEYYLSLAGEYLNLGRI